MELFQGNEEDEGEEKALAEAYELNRRLKQMALAGGDDVQAFLQQMNMGMGGEEGEERQRHEQYARQQRQLGHPLHSGSVQRLRDSGLGEAHGLHERQCHRRPHTQGLWRRSRRASRGCRPREHTPPTRVRRGRSAVHDGRL